MSIFDTLKSRSADPSAGVANSFSVLPVGRYHFIVEKATERPYIDGVKHDLAEMSAFLEANPNVTPGTEVQFVFRVASGELAGRKLFWTTTLVASSNQRDYGNFTAAAKASAGLDDIVALTKRCKLAEVTSWDAFLAAEFMANVTHRKNKTGDKTYEQVGMRIRPDEKLDVSDTAVMSIPAKSDEPPF